MHTRQGVVEGVENAEKHSVQFGAMKTSGANGGAAHKLSRTVTMKSNTPTAMSRPVES